MITLQLKRTAKNLSDNAIKNLVLDSGEPLLIKSLTVPTSTRFDLMCSTASNNSTKEVSLPQNLSNLIVIENDKPAIGTTLCVKFNNANDSTNALQLRLNIRQGLNFTCDIKQIAQNGTYSSHIYGTQYNWLSNDTRFFVFDGNYWVIQLPDYYLENPIVFVGDGKNTVDSLYKSGTYIDVSKYISGDNIENGTITIEKLDPDIGFVTSAEVNQDIMNAISGYNVETVQNGFAEINEKIQLDKIYYVICNTPGNEALKKVNMEGLPFLDVEHGETEEKYDGVTFVIKFTYGNTYGLNPGENDDITLKVFDLSGNNVIIQSHPLYVADNPLSQPFYWQKEDTLIFVFNPNYSTASGTGVWNMAGTSAASIIANWCYNNNTAVINGSAIAAGTIAGESIIARSITSDRIAVGSLDVDVFNNELQGIMGNLGEFRQQCASAGGIVAECKTVASESCKLGEIPEDALSAISTALDNNMNRMPLLGTSVVVKFDYANTNFGTNGVTFAFTTDGTNKYFEAPIGFAFTINDVKTFVNIGSNAYDPDPEDPDSPQASPVYEALMHYRWDDNDYRTLMYGNVAGTIGWIITTTSSYLQELASYCLVHNQTWIGGGNIITGTIVADQIQSGLLDTAKVQLVCYGLDDANKNVKNYGGLRYAEGDAGTSEQVVKTRGIELYGSIPLDDPDGEPDNKIVITNAGMRIHIKDGLIQGWKAGGDTKTSWFIDGYKVKIGQYAEDYAVDPTSTADKKLKLYLLNLPDSSAGLASGQVYNNGGVLSIVT